MKNPFKDAEELFGADINKVREALDKDLFEHVNGLNNLQDEFKKALDNKIEIDFKSNTSEYQTKLVSFNKSKIKEFYKKSKKLDKKLNTIFKKIKKKYKHSHSPTVEYLLNSMKQWRKTLDVDGEYKNVFKWRALAETDFRSLLRFDIMLYELYRE